MVQQQSEFDSISLEVLWSRLIAIADEAAAVMVKTAFSPIVRESNDYAFVLMDSEGDSIAENTGGIPSFVGIVPRTAGHMLSLRPSHMWERGDVMITNDPWLATGHLPDVTMVSPIFVEDQLVGFSGSVAHLPDIGGGLWSADCQELYEEGLQIPPLLLWKHGEPNTTLLQMIEINTRVPQQVIGDIHAQAAAHHVAAQRLVELLKDTGMVDLTKLASEIKTRSEAVMRQSIRDIPDGCYKGTLIADGFDHPVEFRVAVTVQDDAIDIDYSGTTSQVDRGINCVLNYTQAYSAYPIKCALDPYTPRNEGSYRPITVRAPVGSILNPQRPAAVGARHLTGHLLAGVIYSALSQAIPEMIIADCGSAPSMRAVFSGFHRNKQPFSAIVFASGGMGASANYNGLSTTPFPTNVGVGSIEALESVAPLVIWSKELRSDSGGAGENRGGLGQELTLEVRSEGEVRVALLADRTKYPPIGLKGGRAGAGNEIIAHNGQRPHPKSRFRLKSGEFMTLRYAGGGGFGPPEKRSSDKVRDDLLNEYITYEAARHIYKANNQFLDLDQHDSGES